ncbi:MAG TPA: alpha/beta hydrolase [Pirellulales bacterium]|jgi:acetyl esterase/lipase|nr:alpha/beta hydrolase [Pirellulales bacterium]
MLRLPFVLTATLIFFNAAALLAAADERLTLDVWPGMAPGEAVASGEERFEEQKPGQREVKRLTNVSKPTITFYRPPRERDTGTAVVICPGGGYHILAMDLEGEEVATWLNTIGVTGIVLKYRVPHKEGRPPHEAPLNDAERAMSLVRSQANDLGLAADRIGILGFSAGGHLAAATSTNFDQRTYEALDAADKVSCRPDFTVLVYPAYLVDKEGKLSPEIRVTKESPPTFFAHAYDDGIGPENSIGMFTALKQAGVSAELHIYASGGHGFGLRPSEHAASTWPARCEEWMRGRGLIGE